MTYPHRTGQAAAPGPAQTRSTGWTVRKATPAAPQPNMPMRRYEVMALTPEGDLIDEIRAAPATPLFESAFTAIARGALLMTEEGPVAVEDLMPGMRIETRDNGFQTLLWRGATNIVPRPMSPETSPFLYRIPVDSFGPQRPMPDLMLGPHARLLHRNPGLVEIAGQDRALAPLAAFEDSVTVIRVTPASPVRLFHLGFARHEVIAVNGVEIESMHPGPELVRSLAAPELKRFLSIFPHVRALSQLGPLLLPRLSLEAAQVVTAA